jgi:hypothetical protein
MGKVNCRRSLAIFGASGSGKTSSSGFQIGKALVRDRNKVSGLILGSKPEDREFWQKLFAKAGRQDDLVVVDGSGKQVFNVLDFELQAGADTRELTQCLMVMAETLKRGTGAAEKGDRDPFWRSMNEMLLYHAITIVRLATGRVDPWHLQLFINSHAQTLEDLKTDAFKNGIHNRFILTAYKRPKTPRENAEFQAATEYYLNHIAGLSDKTRSSAIAGVNAILFVLNSGVVKECLAGETTVSPALLDQGKWVFLDFPLAENGAAGSMICSAWKYATQRHILRRHAADDSFLTVLWIDEYQNHLTSFDATYLAQSRSHYGAMIVLTQSVHSFYAELGRDTGEHQADALLTNFGTKIFHSVGDDKTAGFASSLVGKSLQTFHGGSMAPQEDLWDELMGKSRFTGSFSTHYENILQHNVFMNMRTGGPANGFLCDAIVIKSGEPFFSGSNYLSVAFSQR